MSHRKVHSQGNIPFAWEAKPGVSKVTNKADFPTETGFPALSSKLSQPPLANDVSEDSGEKPVKGLDQNDIKIPLPPCLLKVPSRSASGKGLKWQAAEEDPFLLAFKVCTRTTSTTSAVNSSPGNKFVAQKNKRGSVGLIGSKLKSKYSVFSCKNSCEVKDGSFVKLPPVPRDRIRL
ncbi:hypothetical protein RchiOBHm_Chr2g0108721 [Rosa chinensis]|uniref:Uncharacterized protein n=1 Tax=Rosa chinensis TaxID=74649 RepID=A0A2P6RP93_ROSCH|nr:hypothetical protein RchiOBHm_Chr2g0108721 [Rosa chinensis]